MSPPLPRVFSIPPGVAFLPTLAEALLSGQLVQGFRIGDDPLAMADATIFVPTRRAARELRAAFASPGRSAILPVILPLGDVDNDEALFDTESSALDFYLPVGALERIMLLAPMVQAWKRRLPGHVAALFEEELVVPASAAEAVWLARDVAALMDEIETAECDLTKLSSLVDADLARWWQVTLEFLQIVTAHWPAVLAARNRVNPAAHRSALIDAAEVRLSRHPPLGPVIAAGSTGSIPATARLLAAISRLPMGAVVLPGLDFAIDDHAWSALDNGDRAPSLCGHPQFGLKRLLTVLGVERRDVVELAGPPSAALGARASLVSEALQPAETTDRWAEDRAGVRSKLEVGALEGVSLVEAANERDEALAIAYALRRAAAVEGATAALVTADRNLARRVSAELLRFGLVADDSAGTPLATAPAAILLQLLAEAAMRPGDPVVLLSLVKHPLLLLGRDRAVVRRAAELIELAALRGGTGRPDLRLLAEDFDDRSAGDKRGRPAWFAGATPQHIAEARQVAFALSTAAAPLLALRGKAAVGVTEAASASAAALETLGRSAAGGVEDLYRGERGEKLADFLRSAIALETPLAFAPDEWPDVLTAMLAGETVKPRPGAGSRIAIWGALEARLQHVDTLVCGGLNEGSWPGRADPGRFMSRVMKVGLALDPPERRIGQAAHDFQMAMGAPSVVLTRSARSGDAPSVPSRWLQRLLALVGEDAAAGLRARGGRLLADVRSADAAPNVPFAERPNPKPPLDVRPKHFSVTEIETLRRDPYAIYARRILGLMPLQDLVRDPGASERGSLFHDILGRFTESGVDPKADNAAERLMAVARRCFREAELPVDVEAVWSRRFAALIPGILAWEREHRAYVDTRHPEALAARTEVGLTGVTLSARADRIDLLPGGSADILDYKTGSSPSKKQAHTLLSPQLALEGALLRRGAFADWGKLDPADLAYIRLKPNGRVLHESILEVPGSRKSAVDLADEAWDRLERLLRYYCDVESGYLSRVLPFREGELYGDYDHLARVLEWSAGSEKLDEVDLP